MRQKISYLDRIGFRSTDLMNLNKNSFKFYFEKPEGDAIQVSDLWSDRDKQLFLNQQGMQDVERFRIRQKKIQNLGLMTVSERRQHDKFRDLVAYEKLPKLTRKIEGLRNFTDNKRVVGTFVKYLHEFETLETHTTGHSPRVYSLAEIKRSNRQSPKPSSEKKLQIACLDTLISSCTDEQKLARDFLRSFKRQSPETKSPGPKPQVTLNLARKIKSVLDIGVI